MSWKREEKLTHVGAVGMRAEAAQTLWAVWSNWGVRFHLISHQNPAHNLIGELYMSTAPLLPPPSPPSPPSPLPVWKSHCKQWGGPTDQNKWCFCAGAGSRWLQAEIVEVFARERLFVTTQSKWIYEAPVGRRHQSSKLFEVRVERSAERRVQRHESGVCLPQSACVFVNLWQRSLLKCCEGRKQGVNSVLWTKAAITNLISILKFIVAVELNHFSSCKEKKKKKKKWDRCYKESPMKSEKQITF